MVMFIPLLGRIGYVCNISKYIYIKNRSPQKHSSIRYKAFSSLKVFQIGEENFKLFKETIPLHFVNWLVCDV